MLLNCGVGEDSWESLGLQGDPTSPSWRKSVLNIHWKDWHWSWNSNTLATWCKELTHWKRSWCWERLKAEGEGDNRGRDGWMASLTRWTWVWVSSGSWSPLKSVGLRGLSAAPGSRWRYCVYIQPRLLQESATTSDPETASYFHWGAENGAGGAGPTDTKVSSAFGRCYQPWSRPYVFFQFSNDSKQTQIYISIFSSPQLDSDPVWRLRGLLPRMKLVCGLSVALSSPVVVGYF